MHDAAIAIKHNAKGGESVLLNPTIYHEVVLREGVSDPACI